MKLEDLSDEELAKLEKEFERLRERAEKQEKHVEADRKK